MNQAVAPGQARGPIGGRGAGGGGKASAKHEGRRFGHEGATKGLAEEWLVLQHQVDPAERERGGR